MKFLALVAVAGGIGVALGMGLSKLSERRDAATRAGAEPAATTAAGAAAIDPAVETIAQPTTTAATAATTATATSAAPATTATPPAPRAAADPLAKVDVRVLDARLFTDDTPSGRRRQNARVTVRLRAENAGSERVTLERPALRVGSVRVRPDPGAARGARFHPLAAGAAQTVTLRFAVNGDATPKLVRDRRARILIAGQSVALRVKVRAPSH